MRRISLCDFADLRERAAEASRESLGGLADVWRLAVDGAEVRVIVAGDEALVMESGR